MGFDWFGLDSEVLNKDKYTKIDDNTFVFEEGYYCGLGNVHKSLMQIRRQLTWH